MRNRNGTQDSKEKFIKSKIKSKTRFNSTRGQSQVKNDDTSDSKLLIKQILKNKNGSND